MASILDGLGLEGSVLDGHHYRRTGLSSQATLQWHLTRTEQAFTCLHIQPADQIETFTGGVEE